MGLRWALSTSVFPEAAWVMLNVSRLRSLSFAGSEGEWPRRSFSGPAEAVLSSRDRCHLSPQVEEAPLPGLQSSLVKLGEPIFAE